MKFILISFVKAYRFIISPLTGASCRFHPTCSAYMIEAIEKHGAFMGVFLGMKRVSRCHPFHKGNYDDPVPDLKPFKMIATKGWFSYKLKKLNILDNKYKK